MDRLPGGSIDLRSLKSMMRHLIHIGYPKAASTYLQGWFAAHPQIAYSLDTLAGSRRVYDLIDIALNSAKDMRWFVTSAEAFIAPPVGSHVSSDDGLQQKQEKVCQALASLFPEAHILIVTRGFRSAILSAYSQYVRMGGTADFAAIMGGGADGLADRDPLAPLFRNALDGSLWNYDHLIGLYRAAFGQRVTLLPYELLAEDQAGLRHVLEQLLELDPSPFSDTPANASLSADQLYWCPRIARTFRRLPQGHRLHRAYVEAMEKNRLGPLIRLLRSIRRGEPPSASYIPEEIIERMRSHALLLKEEPLYARFADDY